MSKVVLVHDNLDAEILVHEQTVGHYERSGWRRKEPVAPAITDDSAVSEQTPAGDPAAVEVTPEDTPAATSEEQEN